MAESAIVDISLEVFTAAFGGSMLVAFFVHRRNIIYLWAAMGVAFAGFVGTGPNAVSMTTLGSILCLSILSVLLTGPTKSRIARDLVNYEAPLKIVLVSLASCGAGLILLVVLLAKFD